MGTSDRKLIFKGIIAGIIFFLLSVFAIFLHSHNSASYTFRLVPSPAIKQANYLSYQGKTGKTALALLKEKAHITTTTSGLIDSINGRKADNSRHEYWAFSINGKLAEVGPADYATKDTDKIEWKIETY